jgi:hypothetical protein
MGILGRRIAGGVLISIADGLIVLAVILAFLPAPGERTTTGSGADRARQAGIYVAPGAGQEPSATQKFELSDNLIFVQVRANDSQPLNFIVDTGASMSFLSQRQARALGLVVSHQQEGNFGTGEGQSKIGFARDVRLQVGGVSLPLKSVVVLPADDLEPIFGRGLDGIVGAEFFNRYVVEVDYDTRVLRCYEPGSYLYQGSGETIPLTVVGGRPFVKASITVAGIGPIAGKFILDLGDNRALGLNSPFVRKHTILTVEQKTIKNEAHGIAGGAPELLGRVERFELGKTVLRMPVVAFSTAGRGSTSSSAYDGVIGTEIFRRFKVILDYSRNRMILEPGAALGDAFEVDMLGVAWLAKGADFRTFEVDRVKESSPAAEAGLLAGDIIAAIDGRLAGELSLDQVKQMFRRDGKEYACEIKRGDQLLKVKLKTRRLI